MHLPRCLRREDSRCSSVCEASFGYVTDRHLAVVDSTVAAVVGSSFVALVANTLATAAVGNCCQYAAKSLCCTAQDCNCVPERTIPVWRYSATCRICPSKCCAMKMFWTGHSR